MFSTIRFATETVHSQSGNAIFVLKFNVYLRYSILEV